MILTTETIQKAIDLRNAFKELYSITGIISIESWQGIQVTKESFLDTYTDYEVIDLDDERYPYLLRRTENGITLFTLSKTKPC